MQTCPKCNTVLYERKGSGKRAKGSPDSNVRWSPAVLFALRTLETAFAAGVCARHRRTSASFYLRPACLPACLQEGKPKARKQKAGDSPGSDAGRKREADAAAAVAAADASPSADDDEEDGGSSSSEEGSGRRSSGYLAQVLRRQKGRCKCTQSADGPCPVPQNTRCSQLPHTSPPGTSTPPPLPCPPPAAHRLCDQAGARGVGRAAL